mmetsp:Transcript_150551/g.419551  ORF Transcript_150551/g.419551 Transcript_150551/m.419551 type:complete len:273 (+) Transcript_150551:2745-3563(+)
MPITEYRNVNAESYVMGTSDHAVPPHSKDRWEPTGCSSGYGTWPPASAFMILTFWLPRKSSKTRALLCTSPMVAVLGSLIAISAPVFSCFRRTTILSSVLAEAPSFTKKRRHPSGLTPWPRTRTASSPPPEPVARKKGFRPQKTMWLPRTLSTCPERYGCVCASGRMGTCCRTRRSLPSRSSAGCGLEAMTNRKVSGRMSSWWSPACLNSSTSGSDAPFGTSSRNVFSSVVNPTKSFNFLSRLWLLWPPQKNFSSLHSIGMSIVFPGFFCSS